MNALKLIKGLLSIYIVLALVTGGLLGIMIFAGVSDEGGVEGTVITVKKSGGGDHTTIQAAVNAASPNDTIMVYAGAYTENVVVGKTLTIVGAGYGNTSIDGGMSGTPLKITTDWVNVTGFTMKRSGFVSWPNLYAGIHLSKVRNVHAYGNHVDNNGCGIYLEESNNNTIEDNICTLSGWRDDIYLQDSHFNIVRNNTYSSRNQDGIYLGNSKYNLIDNNTGFNCSAAVYLASSPSNFVKNNTIYKCTSGTYSRLSPHVNFTYNLIENCTNGFYCYDNVYNNISYNTIKNTSYGIRLAHSNVGNISNNTMIKTGIVIEFSVDTYWDDLRIDTSNTVNKKPVYFWKDRTGGTVPIPAGQVLLYNCTNVIIENQNLSETSNSVYIESSSDSIIRSSTCILNKLYGIHIQKAGSNKIYGNTFSMNSMTGIYIDDSSWQNITNNDANWNINSGITVSRTKGSTVQDNDCNYNSLVGIVIWISDNTDVINNNCNYNKRTGMGFDRANYCNISSNTITYNNMNGMEVGTVSYHNKIFENNCSNNNWNGVESSNADWNIYSNNIFSYNGMNGFDLRMSDDNHVMNNTMEGNTRDGMEIERLENTDVINNTVFNNRRGIYLYIASSNYVSDNKVFSNDDGIYLDGSDFNPCDHNAIKDNNITDNTNGIYFSGSHFNKVFENVVSSNSVGFYFSDSETHQIYHNNIISNSLQVTGTTSSNWNNSQQEGNYWSDYTGVDNGADGRTAGDGIGDTKLPHLNRDNYPYIIPNGWYLPGTPILTTTAEAGIDKDGDYLITWTKTPRATEYKLEASNTSSFTEAEVLYSGPDSQYMFIDMDNNTYYYRVKAFNDQFESDWSNILEVVVDWTPNPPSNLTVTAVTGSEVNLSWEPSPDPDIHGYNILVSKNPTNILFSYISLITVDATLTKYTVTDLKEEETYYFAVFAHDSALTNSSLTNIVEATLPDVTRPKAPTGLVATPLFNDEIYLEWDANYELDLQGYHIFMNDTGHGPGGNFSLIYTMGGSKTSYAVRGLTEQTKYHFKLTAFDEVPNNSTFSKTASAETPDLIHPDKPTGLEITIITYESMTLSWDTAVDHDVIGYYIFKSKTTSDTFYQQNLDPHDNTIYLDIDLEEEEKYFYKIKAVDDAGLESEFSDMVFGETPLGPYAPVINNELVDFAIHEDSTDDRSIKLYHCFSDANNDELVFTVSGYRNINVTINQKTGDVILIPKPDWNGKEVLKFSASDGIFNVSESVVVTVVGVNDPPDDPIITSPKNGLEISEGDKIILSAICTDPDLPYGDQLFMVWSSDIAGNLGHGNNISGIILPVGAHVIKLEVFDKDGIQSSALSYVTVKEKTESEKLLENKAALASIIAVIIIVLIVIIVLFIMFRKKREMAEQKVESPGAISPEIVGPEERAGLGGPSQVITIEAQQPTVTIEPGEMTVISAPPDTRDVPQELAPTPPVQGEPEALAAEPSKEVQALPPAPVPKAAEAKDAYGELPLTKPVDPAQYERGDILIVRGEKVVTSVGGGKGTLDQLEKLGELKEKGLITEDDFQQMKSKILHQ